MPDFKQASRFLAVNTPLGEDKLILVSISGGEELSRPFTYHLEMISQEDHLDPQQLIGHPVSIRMDQDDSSERYFHGLVRDFAHTGWGDKGTSFTATIVPQLWTLTQTTDCRIFQEKSTPDILEEVFGDVGLSDYELKLSANYEPHEYCVQYRESDFDFVSRLMEEEGIYYYFKHEQGKHMMVLADSPSGFYKLPQADVELADPNNTTGNQFQIKSWRHNYSFRSGKYAQTDYNFKTPSSDLLSDEAARKAFNGADKLEVYDYPGRHPDNGRGGQLARVRMEELESDQDVASGDGTYRSFSPGGKFKFERHRSDAERGKEYAITSIDIFASIGGYISGENAEGLEYENRFTVVPSSTPFRPKRFTARPVVEGPQTAVIVGPSGEEIYTDEHSRVKVQFHWDRYGKKDEKSSCWVRVSQAHAGKGWGYVDIPRIDEEVIVDFLEGDPDAPIITGRVYNAEVMPPFSLKGGDNAKNKTRRGNTTKTYKGGGFNEMSMDDTPGEEQIRIHGQYNMDTVVENDQTLKVGNDRTNEVGNDETLTVGNDQTEEIGNNRTTKVAVDDELTVGVNRKLQVGASQDVTVGAEQKETVGGTYSLKIGGSYKIALAGALATQVGGDLKEQVAGKREAMVVGGVKTTTMGDSKITAMGKHAVLSPKVQLTALGSLSLKCGASTIKMTPGSIIIKSPLVKIN